MNLYEEKKKKCLALKNVFKMRHTVFWKRNAIFLQQCKSYDTSPAKDTEGFFFSCTNVFLQSSESKAISWSPQ